MRKPIAAGLILAALVTPALAAKYWVVKDSSTKKCSVMEQDQKPAIPKATIYGNGYQSRAEAETAMNQTIVACGGTE